MTVRNDSSKWQFKMTAQNDSSKCQFLRHDQNKPLWLTCAQQFTFLNPSQLSLLGISPEGVDWPNCSKCSFLIFFPSCNHVNLNIVKKDHVHQKMVKIGWPQITILASDHLKWAHSSALGPLFIPKTRYLSIPYTMQPSCMFQNRIQGGQKWPFWHLLGWFSHDFL